MLYFMVDRLDCSTGLIILFFLVGRSTGFECCISWSASLNRPMGVKCTSNHKRCAYNTTRHLYRQSNRSYLCVYRPWENNLTGRLHGAFSTIELTGLNFFVITRTISTHQCFNPGVENALSNRSVMASMHF